MPRSSPRSRAPGSGELSPPSSQPTTSTCGKPDPEGYERALRLLGPVSSRSDVLAFEDTEAGVASAKAAGLRCVGVLGTMGAERLAAADELVERIDVALMQRLLG